MVGMAADPELRLEPWDERGLELERRANVPEMKTFLGGPEPDDQIVLRHQRILDFAAAGTGRMFLIMVPGEPTPAGSVGYWEREWGGETVYELGWKVLTPFQGRGLAVAATVTTVGLAAAVKRHRWAHAFPRVDNAASNAVTRKAGFESLGECDFEYPKGVPIRCNDWRYDLTLISGFAAGSGSTRSRA
jgi:RimJ/RimL family protein N-acetyltransferase